LRNVVAVVAVVAVVVVIVVIVIVVIVVVVVVVVVIIHGRGMFHRGRNDISAFASSPFLIVGGTSFPFFLLIAPLVDSRDRGLEKFSPISSSTNLVDESWRRRASSAIANRRFKMPF